MSTCPQCWHGKYFFFRKMQTFHCGKFLVLLGMEWTGLLCHQHWIRHKMYRPSEYCLVTNNNLTLHPKDKLACHLKAGIYQNEVCSNNLRLSWLIELWQYSYESHTHSFINSRAIQIFTFAPANVNWFTSFYNIFIAALNLLDRIPTLVAKRSTARGWASWHFSPKRFVIDKLWERSFCDNFPGKFTIKYRISLMMFLLIIFSKNIL